MVFGISTVEECEALVVAARQLAAANARSKMLVTEFRWTVLLVCRRHGILYRHIYKTFQTIKLLNEIWKMNCLTVRTRRNTVFFCAAGHVRCKRHTRKNMILNLNLNLNLNTNGQHCIEKFGFLRFQVREVMNCCFTDKFAFLEFLSLSKINSKNLSVYKCC